MGAGTMQPGSRPGSQAPTSTSYGGGGGQGYQGGMPSTGGPGPVPGMGGNFMTGYKGGNSFVGFGGNRSGFQPPMGGFRGYPSPSSWMGQQRSPQVSSLQGPVPGAGGGSIASVGNLSGNNLYGGSYAGSEPASIYQGGSGGLPLPVGGTNAPVADMQAVPPPVMPMEGFARGGKVRLNPRYAAQRLGGMGRHGDTMMMHVNPRELPGLAALSPNGRLSVNPQTGMPEAFNLLGALGSLLGGVAGTFLLPGIGTGIGAGLGNLGGQAISGKNINLGESVLSGILSYGLGSAVSGLAGGLGGIAGDAGSQVALSAARAAEQVPISAGHQAAQEAISSGVQSMTPGASAALSAPGAAVGSSAGDWASKIPASSLATPPVTPASAPMGSETMGMFQRAGQNLTNPDALYNTFGKNFMKTTLPILGGAYGLASGVANDPPPMTPPPGTEQRQPDFGYRKMRYEAPQSTNMWNPDPRGREQTYFSPNPGWSFYQSGGKVQPPKGEKFDQGTRLTFKEAERWAREIDKMRESANMDMGSENPFNRRSNPVGRYANGGPISGPGGGLDDAIPAIIDGQAPASLSSGEWVAPAHFVSALGNGSTEDGIRQLEGMTDRVLKRKYGTSDRKPRPLSPARYLPA